MVQADWEYWEYVIKPMLGSDVEMVGEVSGSEKDHLLRHARAVLFPIRWPEPFGLVMPEALACGTPVLALRQGSVPELICDGVTGFIGETEDDLVDAVARLETIDRWRCRLEAEQRFSPAAMASAYECVYEKLVQRRAMPAVFDLGRVAAVRASQGPRSVARS
jgi:glycosyltransferase involved in cell wall biosynthesis